MNIEGKFWNSEIFLTFKQQKGKDIKTTANKHSTPLPMISTIRTSS